MAAGFRTFRGGLLLGVLLIAVTITVTSAQAPKKAARTTTEAPKEVAPAEEEPAPTNVTKKSSSALPEGVNCVDGLLVPIWRPYENLSSGDRICRGLLYTLLMVYLFVGVSIVSDRFMESIEMITAQEKEVSIKDRKTGKNTIVIVKVWNETVANLTLMALGSSAPEILLSVIEIWAKDFYAGDLGPGTIVGSAAFNLFMIIGLCMYVIPDDEVRKIKHLRVFIVTSTWSVFAYIWLYAILGPISYGVVEVWEGVFTFLFFPMCVYSAYVAERRMFCYKYMHKSYRMDKRGVIVQSEKAETMALRGQEKFKDLDEDMDPTLLEFERHRREYINAMKRIRLENPDVDMAELEMKAREEVMSKGPKSRAYYRIQATRKLAGTKNLEKKYRERLASDAKVEGKLLEAEAKKDDGVTRIYFDPPHYTVMENIGTFEATVVRDGGDLNVGLQVDYKTEDGTALAGPDYIEKAGTLYFPPGVTEQTITLEVLDDDVFEEDEHFYCRISNPRRKDGIAISEIDVTDEATGETKKAPSIQLGTPHMATIMVLDDDHGGLFQFDTHELEITENVGVLQVKVNRQSGARGKVGIPFTTEEGTAKAGKDFEHVEGELVFNNEENEKFIEIPIVEEESYEKNVVMYCCIGEPRHISGPPGEHSGVNYDDIDAKDPETLTEVEKIALLGRPKLGEVTKIQIRIKESKEFKSSVDRMMQRGNASMMMGAVSWRDQFMEAFSVQAGDDDEEEEEGGEEGEEKMPTCGDYIMHFLTLFWKIIFAFIPPSGLANGYPCFVVSIAFIGVCTAVIGDVAGHLGCFIFLKDSVNAIAFVALGTSVPDTFASKIAAINDDSADNSVGNVTGSNAVNVFLGIGIAWSMASIYWWTQGSVFYVNPGSLGFSVTLFCCEALFAIFILMCRRSPAVGGELGGPPAIKKITSGIFVCLWLGYVTISALEAYKVIDPGF